MVPAPPSTPPLAVPVYGDVVVVFGTAVDGVVVIEGVVVPGVLGVTVVPPVALTPEG